MNEQILRIVLEQYSALAAEHSDEYGFEDFRIDLKEQYDLRISEKSL